MGPAAFLPNMHVAHSFKSRKIVLLVLRRYCYLCEKERHGRASDNFSPMGDSMNSFYFLGRVVPRAV